ncbi:MAG TPA: branched-chain amino acid ABC transporter permease [Acidimicrobiales bacterium]|nr:branched-chain amino acid ABC transporter permease [Acidimicrobiales bacterium]
MSAPRLLPPLLLAALSVLLLVAAPSHAQEEAPGDPAETDVGEAPQADTDGDDTDVDEVTSVGGTLRSGDDEPIAGVDITVSDLDGNEVGAATTADDGSWSIELPGGGRYVVTLDQETLPDDVTLRDPERDSVERNVRTGRETTAIFQFGEGARTGTATLDRIAQAALTGLRLGLIIAMASIGLSLIFGTSGLINFAHGELVTFGAVVAWYLNLQGPELHLLAAAAIAIVIAGGLGAGLEKGLWQPLRARKLGLFQLLVISIGLSLVLRHGIQLFFGGGRRRYTDFVIQERLSWGPLSITERDIWIMVISTVVLVAVAVCLQRTRMGKAMRAVSDNVDLAESSGIDVKRVLLFVWVAGAGLAASGGILLGTTESVSYLMGFRLLLLMFAAVILGGLGTAYGAMVGAIVIGLVTEISVVWFSPELKLVFALFALIIVLLVRPQGILGMKERLG